ncbi:AAA family ATPase [Opitutus terrae]|uniref:Putative cytidylate kinase n=1 Tax=Opitutus terrae (strain DSM 11246 / JCM 15787 / PB90-1) TaxID=452637 RepID=B1ZSC7_OPITP|nr:cytidylate kinase family protein [Opitutus terrae]ACB75726.1 putative cytidylate kinase [Opitutus terrae PB90-1]
MHLQPSLGHAEAYLNVHLSRAGRRPSGHESGPFVTVSRESGASGSTFARALATRLDRDLPGETPWTVFDRNLVETMLQSEHLSPRLARFLPEDHVSEIDASIGELLGLHPSIWNLIQQTNELMRQIARTGYAILVGRGANCATDGIGGGLHVRLVAPAVVRSERTAAEMGLTPEGAVHYNLRVEAARRNYVRSVFATDIDRASAYDLLINVATVDPDLAVDLAVRTLLNRVGVPTVA